MCARQPALAHLCMRFCALPRMCVLLHRPCAYRRACVPLHHVRARQRTCAQRCVLLWSLQRRSGQYSGRTCARMRRSAPRLQFRRANARMRGCAPRLQCRTSPRLNARTGLQKDCNSERACKLGAPAPNCAERRPDCKFERACAQMQEFASGLKFRARLRQMRNRAQIAILNGPVPECGDRVAPALNCAKSRRHCGSERACARMQGIASRLRF